MNAPCLWNSGIRDKVTCMAHSFWEDEMIWDLWTQKSFQEWFNLQR